MATQIQDSPAAVKLLGPPTRKPNLFTLHGGGLHVVFAPSGADGQPHLEFRDPTQTLTFSGDQIRTMITDIGTLVTATIHFTIDSGSTTFTLCVPDLNLQTAETAIQTFGVTTQHRFSVVPMFNQGQIETYTLTNLSGTVQAA